MNQIFSGPDFTAHQQSSLDAFLCLANSALDGIERLDTLNRQTVHSAFENGASNARALCREQGFKQVLSTPTTPLATESATAYFQSLSEISGQMQKEFLSLFEARMEELSDAFVAALARTTQGNAAATATATATARKALSTSSPATTRARKAA